MNVSAQFRARALAREWLIGSWINLGSPVAAELAGRAGFDWVMLDYEHGPGSDDTLLHQLQALSGTPAFPVVRIAANEAPRFKRTLDLGAQGIMVPFVSTVAEAKAAVSSMRFPPRGLRGIAKNSRATGFGADFEDYYLHAHERLLHLVQIETADAIANIDGIAAVDGVDVLFVGPTDLTYGLGIRDQYDNPDFLDAMARVVAAAKKHGKAAGVLAQNPGFVTKCREWGFTFVAYGSDGAAVRTGLLQNVVTLRGK